MPLATSYPGKSACSCAISPRTVCSLASRHPSTAFNAARQSPYASVLAKRGYDKAGLDKAVAVFDALDAAQSAYLTATGAAADSLRVRDQAARELIVWMSKFRRIAGVVLRDKPEMRQKLGL